MFQALKCLGNLLVINQYIWCPYLVHWDLDRFNGTVFIWIPLQFVISPNPCLELKHKMALRIMFGMYFNVSVIVSQYQIVSQY